MKLETYGSFIETPGGHGIWPRNPRTTLNRFHYWRDRLFIACCASYVLNRWILKPRLRSPFLHDHFDDLLLIPCALPLLLLFQRWLGLRQHDEMPTSGEIGLYLVTWSILFEVIGPHIMPWTVGDPWDVLAYVLGGVCSWIWWHWPKRRSLVSPP